MPSKSRLLAPVLKFIRTQERQSASDLWRGLLTATLLAAFAYVFLEWLFLVTKPSFMRVLEFAEKLEILAASVFLLFALCSISLLPLALLGLVKSFREHVHIIIAIGAVVPAAVMGALTLLLIDNFTYTIFKIGIVSTRGAFRGIYAALLLAAAVLWWAFILRKIRETHWDNTPAWLSKAVLTGLVLAALIPFPMILFRMVTQGRQTTIDPAASGELPHILLITSDGVDAANLSLYGYERDTTPNLRELSSASLVAENAFTNGGPTTGSVVSIYTSKNPLQTRVLYPPDILRGEDAYEHLPGILKSQGYYTVQLTIRHFADAYAQNVLEGFDSANGREVNEIGNLYSLARFIPADHANFISEIYQRLADRLKHIFYLAVMENTYAKVTAPARTVDDQRKLRPSLKLLETSAQPVFVHIHLLGTHGPEFEPSKQVFSAGQDEKQQGEWNTDFYDDSIREFDKMVGGAIKELAKDGLLEKTIIIIGSDHGKRWETVQRIPLLIRFPHQDHAGVIKVNVQNMDIAPTLLDYLGVEVPAWMKGHSLLTLGSTQRPILAASSTGVENIANENGFTEVDQTKLSPPFYQFASVTVVKCQRWHRLWLTGPLRSSSSKPVVEVGTVAGYTAPCSESELFSNGEAYNFLVGSLKASGFDVSSLEGDFPAPTVIGLQLR